MKRLVKYSLVTLAALVLLVVALVWFILATETGTALAWRYASPLLPAGVSVASVEGRLAGPLVATGVAVRSETLEVKLARVELDWQPTELLGALLHLRHIDLEGLVVTQIGTAPDTGPGEPFKLPENIGLPVAVQLDRLSLEGFTFRQSPGAAPFTVDVARLGLDIDQQRLRVDPLTLRAPLADVDGTLELEASGDYPVTGMLDWRLRPPGYAPAAAQTRLDGSLKTLVVEQELRAPYNARARVTLRQPLRGLVLDGELTLTDTTAQAIDDGLPPLTLSTDISFQGPPSDLGFKADLDLRDRRYGVASASLRGGFTDQVLNLEQLQVEPADSDARLELNGRVDLAGKQPELDLHADWQRLRWPLEGEALVTSPAGNLRLLGSPDDLKAELEAGLGADGRINGRVGRQGERLDIALDWQALGWPLDDPRVRSEQGKLTLAGTLDNYQLNLDAGVQVPEQPPAQVALAGSGSLKAMSLEQIRIRALDGSLSGSADVAWQPALKVALDVEGEGLDPGAVLPDWPGRLDLALRAEAGNGTDGWTAHIERAEASGKLRGHALDLNARGDYAGGDLALEQFVLASGATRIDASGRIGEALDLDWRIASEDLGELLPEASGQLKGSGSLSGPRQRPRVEADLSGSDLAYREYALASVKLDADIDASGQDDSRLSLALGDGRVGDIDITSLELKGDGNAAGHRLTLDARTSTGNAALALDGELAQPWSADSAWTASLTRAELTYPQLAPWRLQQAAKIRVDAEHAAIERHCWGSGEARLCLEGERDDAGLAAMFTLDKLDFGYFTELLPENLRLEGGVSGSGRFKQATGGSPEAAITLDTTAGRIGTLDAGDEVAEADPAGSMLAFRESELQVELDAEALAVNADLGIREQGGIDLEARVPAGDAPFMQRPLTGHITTDMPDLSFIAELVPSLERLNGRLEGDMHLAGSLGAPQIQGDLALRDGNAVLAGPGLELDQVQVELSGRGGAGLSLSASARSGGGRLTIEGEADLAAEPATADIAIRGQDFQVFNTSEAQVFASPDLNLTMDPDRIELTGKVTVPKADITPHKIPTSAVAVSGDQVIVQPESESGDGIEQAEQATGRAIHAKLRVILGDSVRVEGFGLKARFSGNLLVTDVPGEPTRGSGEIKIVEGTYKAYGQDLSIEDGRILFPGGPITEPGLDVRAVRRPQEDVLVGVNVRGSLRQPKFTLFSDPSMTQQEQLSYLVLGRAPNSTSGSENSAISRAALALGLKSANVFTGSIGERVGIDQVELDSTRTTAGTSQAALVLGKYLSPDLYISYGIGLFEPVSTVRLQYAISSKWKVVTESGGDQSSGDIIYTIESGR